MKNSERLIYRNLSEVQEVPTSHCVGIKQVLLCNVETESKVTQIAKSKLNTGDLVEPHAHPTMDEHFLFIDGNGEMTVDGKKFECKPGQFILVPAKAIHSIRAFSELGFLTFSVAL